MFSYNTVGKISHLLVVILLSLASISINFHLPVPKKRLVNPYVQISQERILGQKDLSLNNRWPNSWVNSIFKQNILLNLAYLRNLVTPGEIDWQQVERPFTYEFRLNPKQTFAFHEDVDQKYKETLVKHTNAHFNASEGFKSDGYLFGDGVCHLASLIYWTAKEANLEAEAPTRHDFAPIADIPKEFGVSIYNNPRSQGSNIKQNLYITNNRPTPIVFRFDYRNDKVKISIVELN